MSKQSRIAIVTDSCIDLPLKYTNKPFIRVVPLNVTFADGDTILDGVDITIEEFYNRMKESTKLPVTSQPSPEQFLKVYRELLDGYDDIVSLHLSDALSGTYNSAILALNMLASEKQSRVHIIDTKMVSLVEGMVFLAAVEAVEQGKNINQVLKVIEEQCATISCIFTVKTLENLRKGGRISHINALLGGFLQIKPVLEVGCKTNGKLESLCKVRGRTKAIRQMISMVKERSHNTSKQKIGVMHSILSDQEELDNIISMIKTELEPEQLLVSTIGATVGTHAGIGAIGIVFYE